jgi:hypothetical protein
MDISGTIDAILLSETDTNTMLTVKVKKGAAGDGAVEIGEITGNGALHRLTAPDADLVGAGVDLDGTVRALEIRDLLFGAALRTGGSADQTTRLRARNLDDGAVIELAGGIRTLRAARFGDGLISVPSAEQLSIVGDKRGIPQLRGTALAHPASAVPTSPSEAGVRQAITTLIRRRMPPG